MQFIRLILLLIQVVYVIGDESTKYKVKYHHAKVPRNIAESLLSLNQNLTHQGQFEIIDIRRESIHEKYICLLPSTHNQTIESNEIITLPSTNTSEALVKRQKLKKQAVEAITKSFSTKDCNFAFGVANYWTFAYCYGDKVIQFHSDLVHHFKTGKHKAEQPDFVYLLGKFPGSPSKTDKNDFENRLANQSFILNDEEFLLSDEVKQFNDPLNQLDDDSPKQVFIQQTLYDGTTCAETKDPRQIDIIYKCDPTKEMVDIAEVHEVNICKYQMIINVPRLCSIDEFKENPSEIKIADIDCKLVDQWSSVSMKREIEFRDFFGYPETLAKNQYFPIYKDNKINLADYSLRPLGGGFFFGFRKEKIHTDNPYFNNRNVLLFNGAYTDPIELLQKIGKVFVRSLDLKIPSPIVLGQDKYSVLSLNDSFVVWYEMYNEFGKLLGMIRITRDSSHTDGRILLNLIDPSTMKDHEGHDIVIEKFEAPNNQWNFESFYRPQPVDEKDKAKQTFEPEKKPQDNLANTKDSPGQQHVINADGLTMEELSQILAEYLKVGGVINPDIPIDINEIVKDFHDKGKQTQQDVEIKEESVDESMEQQIDKVGDIIEENGELDLSDVQFEDSSDPSTEDDSNSEKPQVDSDTDIYNNNPKQQVLQHDEL